MVRAAGLLALGLALLAWSASAPAQEPARVEVAASPRALLFGDALRIHVEVVLDRDLADPESVELETDFAPFEIEEIQRAVEEGDELSGTSFAITLRCLEAACLPARGTTERRFDFPPARVQLADEDGGRTLEAPIPAARIESRLSEREVRDEAGWSYEDRALAPVGYAVEPGLATAVLWVGAGALALLGGVLALYAATGSGPVRALAPYRGTPLERALALARRAAPGAAEERRKALERLARELRRAGHPDLAERSGALAWPRQAPTESAIRALVVEVERAVAEAGP
jgi:hypothetical protein